jgi:ADP-ribosylglycohydrolase
LKGAILAAETTFDSTDPGRMISETLSFTAGISRKFDTALSKVSECIDWPNEEDALKYLGEGWIAEEALALALALYCFLKYPNDYKKVVLRGANTDGDSDSIACISGSISGARLGFDAIPKA